jgi:hypothetical protein
LQQAGGNDRQVAFSGHVLHQAQQVTVVALLANDREAGRASIVDMSNCLEQIGWFEVARAYILDMQEVCKAIFASDTAS